MKRTSFCKRTVFFVISFLVFSSFSCKSTPEVDSSDVSYGQGMSLAVPHVEKKNTFSTIDKSILDDVKKGTSASLKNAFASLRQSDQNYTEEQAVILNIINGIVDVLYPNDKIQWPVSTLTEENDYISILESVKKGVYDDSATEKDFFVKVLPSLVLITSPNSIGFFADSKKSLDEALVEFPNSFMATYLRGLLAFRQQSYTEANSFFQKAFKIDSSYANLKKTYAASLIKTGDNDLAFSLASELLEKDSENFELLRLCAYATLNAGKTQEAQLYIVRALQQQPNNADFILLRAKMLMVNGEYLNASSLLDAYSRNDNTSKDYLLMRATLQRDWNKNLSAASNTISDALYLYPDDVEVLIFATSLMLTTKQQIGNRSSHELVDYVLTLDAENLEAKELLLKIFVSENQWQKAYELSSELIKNKAVGVNSILTRIEICINLKNMQDARRALSVLSEKTDDKAVLDLELIRILIAEGNKAEALKQISLALNKDYSNQVKSDLYYERSRISSNSESQLADLRSCLTSNPRNLNALLALYNYYFDKKDYRKSRYYLRQAIALNPQDSSLLEFSAHLDELLNAQ